MRKWMEGMRRRQQRFQDEAIYDKKHHHLAIPSVFVPPYIIFFLIHAHKH